MGQGGFGITYIGWDLNLEQTIAIKEFFPGECVMRDARTHSLVLPYPGEREVAFKKGRERFINEARALAKFAKDDGIVGVRGFVNENGTSYIIMDFIEGETLKDYAKKRGGKLSVQETLTLFWPLFQSLENIHKKDLLHRDISPDNIMLQSDGRLVLLDFGAARQISMYGEHSNTINVKHGFAPEEQYRTHGGQGPWTDIYSLCATIYYLTTGVIPQQALERMADHAQLVPPSQLGASFTRKQEKAILKGLSVRGDQRQQTVSELKAELYEEAGVGPTLDLKRRGKETGKRPVYSPTVKPNGERESDSEQGNDTQPFVTKPVKRKKERKRNNQNLRKAMLFVAIISAVMITAVIAIVSFVRIKPITEAIQAAITEQELPLTISGMPRRMRQLEAERSDGVRCYEITANSPDYASFGTLLSDNSSDLPSFEFSVDTETTYREKLREYVSAYVQNLTASNTNYPIAQKKIVFHLQQSTNGWIATMAEDDLSALQKERENAVSLVVESIYQSLPVNAQMRIAEQKQSILQTIYQDEYLASETGFLSVNDLGQGYYEVSLHFPAPQYAADNAIFANEDVQHNDGNLLVYYEDGIVPVPIVSVEDWETRLADSSVEELAETYTQDADYSAYVKMLQDVYEVYAQQLLDNGEVYDAFLVYVSCENREKTMTLGKNLACISDGKLSAIRRDGDVLSNEFIVKEWHNIVYLDSGDDNLIGIDNNRVAKFAGYIVDLSIMWYSDVNSVTWDSIETTSANTWNIAAIKSDNTAKAIGSLNIGWKTYEEVNLNKWTNIKGIAASRCCIVGLKNDGTVIWKGKLSVDGSNVEFFDFDLSDWQDIASIYVNDYTIIGVKNDGTILSAGRFSSDVSTWENVAHIETNSGNIFGLCTDGTVLFTGKLYVSDDEVLPDVSGWKEIVGIAASYDKILGLCRDGTVLSAGETNTADWEKVVSVYCDEFAAFGLREDGTILTWSSDYADWDLW